MPRSTTTTVCWSRRPRKWKSVRNRYRAKKCRRQVVWILFFCSIKTARRSSVRSRRSSRNITITERVCIHRCNKNERKENVIRRTRRLYVIRFVDDRILRLAVRVSYRRSVLNETVSRRCAYTLNKPKGDSQRRRRRQTNGSKRIKEKTWIRIAAAATYNAPGLVQYEARISGLYTVEFFFSTSSPPRRAFRRAHTRGFLIFFRKHVRLVWFRYRQTK